MSVPSQYKSEKAREEAFAAYDSILSRWPVPYEARFVDTRFGSTHLLTSGGANAPPLILIPGLGANATSWIFNIAALAGRYRVYALDTIGDVGKSAGTRPAYGSGNHGRWLNEVYEQLGLVSARVAGHSLGGRIAFGFALAFPQRVERLALLAPACLQRMRTWFILRAIFASLFPTVAVAQSLIRYMSSPRSPGMPDWMVDATVIGFRARRMNTSEPSIIQDAELAMLRVPTLLLLGSDEVLYDSATAASRVRSVAPNIQVEIIGDAGHAFPIERPEATDETLLRFFA
jgi:pimeloyl-ACP methyl ester carboxylesterase